MRDTSGDHDAPPQLLNISLSFEHTTGCHKAHRDCLGPRHFPSLCETVQGKSNAAVLSEPTSRGRGLSTVDHQLVGGSTQVESAATLCIQ